MRATVYRYDYTEKRTIGDLLVDDVHVGYTLEDAVRPDGVKIAGITAIPAGLYRMRLTKSKRFGRVLPLIIGVPGFVGVRIHRGNDDGDTSGCILIAENRHDDGDRIYGQLEDYLVQYMQEADGDTHLLEVINGAVWG